MANVVPNDTGFRVKPLKHWPSGHQKTIYKPFGEGFPAVYGTWSCSCGRNTEQYSSAKQPLVRPSPWHVPPIPALPQGSVTRPCSFSLPPPGTPDCQKTRVGVLES